MATKFYLASSGTPAATVAASAYWTHDAGALLLAPCSKTKTSTAINYNTHETGASSWVQRHAQFVSSEQLAAYDFTAADTIKFQISPFAVGVLYIALSVRVVSANGGTVRGILYEGTGPTAIDTSGFVNRSIGAAGAHVHVQNSVSMSGGDRIVIEVGALFPVAESHLYPYIGDDNASDLPENETGTDNFNPWCELSPTIADYSAAATNVVLNVI